jgi:anti-sigma B factor antagonist
MQSDAPLVVDQKKGRSEGIRIFHCTGPITLGNVFTFQEAVRSGELATTSILDLSAVPYLDSAGMGAIVNFYTHCQRLGTRMIVAGVNNRARELFILTKVQNIIPMAESADEAQQQA